MKRFLFLLVAIATVVALAPKPGYAHRYFDTWAARWTTPDPMLQKYPGWSPYAYGYDNPVRFIDPNGKEVKGYTERLTSNVSIWAAIAMARHTFLYVSTPNQAWIIELGGPRNGSLKGTPLVTSVKIGFDPLKAGGRAGVEEEKVERPEGIGPNNYSFEKKILKLFKVMKGNLPNYNFAGPNSNGFAKFLIQQSGGKIDLPLNAYGSSTKAYEKAYQEYLHRQEQQHQSPKPKEQSGNRQGQN